MVAQRLPVVEELQAAIKAFLHGDLLRPRGLIDLQALPVMLDGEVRPHGPLRANAEDPLERPARGWRPVQLRGRGGWPTEPPVMRRQIVLQEGIGGDVPGKPLA